MLHKVLESIGIISTTLIAHVFICAIIDYFKKK